MIAMMDQAIQAGDARTTVRLRRRQQPDISSPTLAVLSPGAPVAIIQIVNGTPVLNNALWAELANGGFCWTGGLTQAPPEADLAAGFHDRAVAVAAAEWEFFGSNTQKLGGTPDHDGHKETEDGWYQRVGEYWADGTATHGIDGRNTDWYWSATFISWVAKKAGAGTRFRYSRQHSVYISQAIRDRQNQRVEAGYWCFRLSEEPPAVGDIVCWSREDGVDYDHQKSGDYAGHSDYVVAVRENEVDIIGGNVGNSVTKRPLALEGGLLKPATVSGEILFGLMKCRID
jgi:hypothetical protein